MFSFKDLFKYFFEVLDTTKSDREAIILRCPRGGREGVIPQYGLGQSPSGVLKVKPLASYQ